MGVAALLAASALPALAEDERAVGAAGEFSTQVIAQQEPGGAAYRIPAVVQLGNGDLLAAYDDRPTGIDAPGPNSVLQRRSTDGGATWQEPTVISQGQDGAEKVGYSDPSYVHDAETGTLFNFHVFSKDTGFWNGEYGNDDADRSVMSANLATSTDGGVTWSHRSLTEIVKPADVRATFATSGHGIQITRGEHAGRLVQQFAGSFRDGSVRAYSVYSDDHGATWQMGTPVGTRMDENKVVELSDGTLMMNSRAHTEETSRWVSYSEDGGATWSEPELDHTLQDPRNNAALIPMNPGAAEGSAAAKELLFSNSDATTRTNGTVRYSCDDGRTWPVAKTYQEGDHAYSDLVALQDGSFGVLYENAPNEQITYGSFDREWLQPFCAAFAPAAASVGAGQQTTMAVTVRNDDTAQLPAGTATLSLPGGWSAGTAQLPALAPGASATVEVPLTAPAGAEPGLVRGEVQVSAGGRALRGDAEVTVTPAPFECPFVDVTSATQFATEICWAAERDYVHGWSDGTFRPSAEVHRDAMAAFLYRMAGEPAVDLTGPSPFTDMKRGYEHYAAVVWAHQEGIATGWEMEDGTRQYRPTAPIERGAMAAFLHRFTGEPEVGGTEAPPFTDVPTTLAFAEEIAWLRSADVTRGYPDGSFRPVAPITRDAMAAFLYRMDAAGLEHEG